MSEVPTNREMMEFILARQKEREERIARDGCCGGVIRAGGICPETGRTCPLYRAAQRVERVTFRGKDYDYDRTD